MGGFIALETPQLFPNQIHFIYLDKTFSDLGNLARKSYGETARHILKLLINSVDF